MDASLLVHFSTKIGGFSKGEYEGNNLAFHVGDEARVVEKNREYIFNKLGIKSVADMQQSHNTNLKTVFEEGRILNCDGIFSTKKDLALLVLVADCIPLLFYEPNVGVIGAVHAGRVGVFEGIVEKSIKKLKDEFGAKKNSIRVWLGPSIKDCCYEVDGEVLKESKDRFPSFVKGKNLSLDEIVVKKLKEYSISQIYSSKICTCCHEEYFSYREKRVCGRQAGIIMLRDLNGKESI